MPLSEETLEKLADGKLEQVLTWSNKRLLELEGEMLSYKEAHAGVEVFFDVIFGWDKLPGHYRVAVMCWDDGPAREEFPVMTATILEFEE